MPETRGEREIRESYDEGFWLSPMGVRWQIKRSGWHSMGKFRDFMWHKDFVKYVKALYPDYDD